MTDWSAPQWLMAGYLLIDMALPPITYAVCKAKGTPLRLTWPEFVRARMADTIGKVFILSLLIWDGFF